MSDSGERSIESRSGSKFKQSVPDSSRKAKENQNDLQSVSYDVKISKKATLEKA